MVYHGDSLLHAIWYSSYLYVNNFRVYSSFSLLILAQCGTIIGADLASRRETTLGAHQLIWRSQVKENTIVFAL